MKRFIIALALLLAGLEGAAAQSHFKKANLPTGGHYYYPTEAYFSELKSTNCKFEEFSLEQSLCISHVDGSNGLRRRWEALDSLAYQIKLNPRVATPEYLKMFRDTLEQLCIESVEFPDIRKKAEDDRSFGG